MSAAGPGWAVCAAVAAGLLIAPGPPARQRLGTVRPEVARRWPVPPAPLAVALLGAVLGGLACGVAGSLAGGLVATTVRRRRARSRDRSRAGAEATELAESLARIVEELRTGAHPAAALQGVRSDGALADRTLGPAAAAARLGDDVPAALARTAARGPAAVRAELQRIAAAWSLSDRHGAPLADLLDGVLTDLRWRLAFAARTHARSAGPRATAAVLTALPVLGLGLGHLLGADPLGVLRSGILGQALLLVGTGLVWAGLSWSDRLTTAAAP
ncbi:type II secretion system F family protein [Pseudonocardia sp. WMMC193]|uniref:type II secretion system F family protein n=1 Tax=Pseudonocardia sp. WMMC193 TaxID=2911965 RepID=UPI001F3296BF|nr:type II secretion system protein [Pseudonocardia sp. WMMC193]MCF7551621.1 type II secretion system protein [Pseudonocardia sp. WMMC193]